MRVMASPVSLRVLFGSPLHRFWLLLWRAFGACACMHETMKDDVLRRWVCFDPGLDFGVGPSPHPLISPAGWWERWPLINVTNGSSRNLLNASPTSPTTGRALSMQYVLPSPTAPPLHPVSVSFLILRSLLAPPVREPDFGFVAQLWPIIINTK